MNDMRKAFRVWCNLRYSEDEVSTVRPENSSDYESQFWEYVGGTCPYDGVRDSFGLPEEVNDAVDALLSPHAAALYKARMIRRE